MGRCGQLPLLRHFRQQGLRNVASSCYPAAGDPCRFLGRRSLSIPPKPDFSHLPGARLPRIALSPNKSSPILEITQKQAAEAFQHCFNLVKQHDVDSYLSILALPKQIHPELFSIHALNVELAIIRDKIDSSRTASKDTTGMYRLQFWKDALSSIYGGSLLPVPRQPVAVALCSFAPDAAPLRLENLVTARQQTLGDRPFTTVFELCGYGSRTAGSLLHLRVDALARNASLETEMYKEDIEKTATDLGAAFGVLNLIRSSLPLLTRGIVLLPSDLLSMNGLSPDLVYNRKREEDVRHVVQQMVQVARSQLESGQMRAQQLPRSIRQAFSATAIVSSSLISSIKKANYDLYSSRLQQRDALLFAKLLLHKLFGRKTIKRFLQTPSNNSRQNVVASTALRARPRLRLQLPRARIPQDRQGKLETPARITPTMQKTMPLPSPSKFPSTARLGSEPTQAFSMLNMGTPDATEPTQKK